MNFRSYDSGYIRKLSPNKSRGVSVLAPLGHYIVQEWHGSVKGINYLHCICPIFHCDLKSPNLLVDKK
uniref:Serine/threonine-protein kinase CTR1 n=1 Tax=Tanacetum cinerariifolium TaxID=118510 RepID=A0A699KFU6_TANCI|nr:serine/threonine-protein kinase CTR1 [Tanacetum cinerariifolium]